MSAVTAALSAIPVAVADARFEGDLQLQERGTYQSAVVFDDDDPDVGWFWTQRVTGTGRFNLSSDVSATVSVLSAVSEGVSTSPVERNVLDLQQAFLAWKWRQADVRLGRQEIRLGSQRLVGVRQGTNVRRTWDGLRVGLPLSNWSLDLFALQLVAVESNGVFNDDSDEGRRLAGLYATRGFANGGLEVYYLLSSVENRPTVQGVADQDRHSVGARVEGSRKAWFWNWEVVGQFGDHGDDRIEAWTLATNTGYRFAGRWTPELMLSANTASGDDDPDDGTLGTFDALYPRGSYFSEAAILGPANFYNLNPYLRLHPREDLALSVDVNWYWRLEDTDGAYAPTSTLLRPTVSPEGRRVSRAISLGVDWQLSPRCSLGIVATHAEPGRVISATGPDDDVQFLEITFSIDAF